VTTQDVATALSDLIAAASQRNGSGPSGGDSSAWRSPTPSESPGIDPIRELIYAHVLWNGSARAADAVMERSENELADFNELRVCVPDELRELMEAEDACAGERCVRLHLALNDLWRREQALTLDPVAELSKREVRTYLESLEGVPRFAAARVALLCFGVHVFPVDARLAGLLSEAGVLPPATSDDEAAGKLERAVRASTALDTYLALEQWAAASQAAASPKAPARGRAVASGRKG